MYLLNSKNLGIFTNGGLLNCILFYSSINFLWLGEINIITSLGFPSGSDGKDSACNMGDLGNGTPLQCSCLENPMDGGAW